MPVKRAFSTKKYCPNLVTVWKRGISKQGILKSLVSHVLNFKSLVIKFRTWKTRLFKMSHFQMFHIQTGTMVTVASRLSIISVPIFRMVHSPKTLCMDRGQT